MRKTIRSTSLLLMVLLLPLLTWAEAKVGDPGPELDSSKDYYVDLQTTMGDIVLQLYPDDAPIAVRNFVNLIEGTKPWQDPKTNEIQIGKRFYDGLTFHRVIENFMIQGGDPLGNGRGEPGYTFKNETSPKLSFNNADGLLAMANRGPDTNGAQFFITDKGAYPTHLNGNYTIFGKTVDGIDVVAAIARVPRGRADKPRTDVVINKAIVIRLPKGTDISNKPWEPELDKLKAAADQAADQAAEKVESAKDEAKEKAESAKDEAKEKADSAKDAVQGKAEGLMKKAQEKTDTDEDGDGDGM